MPTADELRRMVLEYHNHVTTDYTSCVMIANALDNEPDEETYLSLALNLQRLAHVRRDFSSLTRILMAAAYGQRHPTIDSDDPDVAVFLSSHGSSLHHAVHAECQNAWMSVTELPEPEPPLSYEVEKDANGRKQSIVAPAWRRFAELYFEELKDPDCFGEFMPKEDDRGMVEQDTTDAELEIEAAAALLLCEKLAIGENPKRAHANADVIEGTFEEPDRPVKKRYRPRPCSECGGKARVTDTESTKNDDGEVTRIRRYIKCTKCEHSWQKSETVQPMNLRNPTKTIS